jgi:SH3-like domain-containing protein
MRKFPFSQLLLSALVVCAAAPAAAEDERPKPPYFGSIKGDPVYMREGPSADHKVKWIYKRRGLPVEVLAEYDVWRRVRDRDGEVGWVHVAMMSRDRTAVVLGKALVPVRSKEDPASAVIARAQPGAIGVLEACTAKACEVKFKGADGWIDRSSIWGIYANERL